MTELWVLCEHEEAGAHFSVDGVPIVWLGALGREPECPGGHPATVEEVVEWLNARGEWPHGIAATPVGKPDTASVIAATIAALQAEDV